MAILVELTTDPDKRLLLPIEEESSDQYAVLGNPIHHSLSPLIHRLFAEQTQQRLNYSAILVPLNGLSDVLNQFQAEKGKGVNITLPFKQMAYSLVNSHTERAKQAQSINTIRFNEDGSRSGDNTDGVGLVRDLIRQGFNLSGKKILILGAGGAVSGILGPLLNEKSVSILIANRTESKAHDLVKQFAHLGKISACSFSSIKDHHSLDMVINALSRDTSMLPEILCHPNTFCYDLSYGKDDTPFLLWAKQQGIHTYSDGLGMLVEQAAESFYFWRGIRPETKPVLKYLHSL